MEVIFQTHLVRMIKNRIYTGVLHHGDAESKIIPELQIIDVETFERAQRLMEEHTMHRSGASANLRGRSLLVGNIFCGHCGNRLTLTTSGRQRVNKDGTVHSEVRARYNCHYRTRHPDKCDGPSGYGVTKLDGIMDQIIRYQLAKISTASGNDLIKEQHEKAIALASSRYRLVCNQLAEKQREFSDYQAETIRVIRGESQLSTELLNELVSRTKAEIQELTDAADTAKRDLEQKKGSIRAEKSEFEQLRTWADLYDNCSFAAKKMIVSQFVKSVHVYRGYTIEVEFNVSFDAFRSLEANTVSRGNERADVYCK